MGKKPAARRIRRDAGLSVEKVAKAADVSPGTVKNLERGRNIGTAAAAAIAGALGVTLDELLDPDREEVAS